MGMAATFGRFLTRLDPRKLLTSRGASNAAASFARQGLAHGISSGISNSRRSRRAKSLLPTPYGDGAVSRRFDDDRVVFRTRMKAEPPDSEQQPQHHETDYAPHVNQPENAIGHRLAWARRPEVCEPN